MIESSILILSLLVVKYSSSQLIESRTILSLLVFTSTLAKLKAGTKTFRLTEKSFFVRSE